MATLRVLILAAFTVGALSDSSYNYNQRLIGREQCAITCPQTEGKFSYRPGQTYEYQYTADIQTSIPGSPDQSNLHMSASVSFDVISQCEMSLRVGSVTLQDSDPTNTDMRQYVDRYTQFKQSLEGKPLRFAFLDGRIDAICPSAEEEVWVLNIKRGILSSFQNTMTSLQGITDSKESDVTGTCPVKYRVVESSGTMLKLKKSKNLLGCTDRSSTQSIFQTVGYKTESEIQSAPILKGIHQCDQEIDSQSKIIKKIECVEKHIFKPFARDNSGATTQLKYRLTFQRNYAGQQSQVQLGPNRLPLLYDHSLSEAEMQSSLREAQQSFTTICRLTQPDVRPEAPGAFAKLVKQMKGLDARNLRQLQSSSQSACPKAKQFFQDAIAVLSTPASVSIIRDLIANNQVGKIEAELLLASIAFVQNPNDEMMSELKNLLQSDIKRASLPVSSVVYTYMKKNPSGNSDITAILKIFEDQLRYNCRSSGEEDKAQMLLALRAIGNTGAGDRIAQTLDRCAANDQAVMSVRIAAINAYRRMPCSVSREQMYRLYSNTEQDSEIRINSYLVVMTCADHTTLSRVHGQLSSEVVNQVGSFVWTHLTNLAETSNPLKSDIRDIITDPKLLKEFNIDKRKFSRNIEFSTFSDYFNVGGSAESNIIMSSKSYVPRSVNLNLTVDLFGESINLLDVGMRAQGLEAILEKHFGPESDLSEALKRDKRQVMRDYMIQNIDRQYQVSRDPLELSYFLRIFGHEIKSADISDFRAESLKSKFDMGDILSKLAQQRTIDLTRSFAFLDTSVSIPTGLGMPIKLGAEGTITAGLTAQGKIDVRRMFAKPSDFDVTGSIRPSAAIEVEGEFGLDAHVTQTRLKVVNRLHSSLLVDGKVTLKNGQVFNFDWNMPQDKIEIFSAESHFYITHRNQDREQRGPRQIEHKQCTGQDITNSLGLEFCGELSYPGQASGMIAPLNGPSAVKIYINKKDTFTSARIEASYIRQEVEKIDTAKFSFNTPGSRVDRELKAEFRLDRTNKDVSLNIKSPWKKISINGQIQSDAELKKAEIRALVDDRIEYSATAELRTQEERDNAIKYVPNIKIVYPGRQPITLEGQLTYLKGRRILGNVLIKNAFSEPITVEGSVQMLERQKQNKYDVNVQVSSPILRGSVVGYVTSLAGKSQTWSSRMDANYQYKNGQKHRLVFNNKVRDTSSPNLKAYSADGSWSTTMWPQYNGRFEFRKSYSSNSIRTTLDAGFDTRRKITIVQSGAYDFSGVDKKLNAEVKVELPYYNVNYETKINHIHNVDMLQSNVTVKHDENKEHSLDIGFKKDNQRYVNAVAEAKLKIAGREPYMFTNTLIERAPRQYHNQLKIDTPGKSLSAISLYKMAQRHEINADIQATGYEPISISGHLNPNLKSAQAKLEVKYGRRNYMTDINWLYRGAPGSFNARASAEVGYLGKKYGLAGEVSRVDRNVSANFQATCGPDKRVLTMLKVSAVPTSPEIKARVEWPGNFVDVVSSLKYSVQDWTRVSDDFEAGLKITSAFPGYEEMGGNVKIDYGQDSLRTNAALAWSRYKRISGELTYARNRADLTVNTPFYGYRSIRANIQFNGRGNSYDISGSAEWEQNRVSMTGRMSHEKGSGLTLTNSGEATLTTPWQGYRQMKLTWRHQNDDGTFWKCHHELENRERNQKYILDIDASNRKQGDTHDLKFKATFTSPIQNWEHVALEWDSNHNYQAIRARGTGSVTWGRNTVRLEHELEVQPRTFIAKAKVTTPFQGYEDTGIDMNNKLESRTNTYTLKNELFLGRPGRRVGLDGTLIFNGPTFNTGIKITTPHPDYPRVGASLRNGQQQDGTWALQGDLEIRRGMAFTLSGRLGWQRNYGAELSLTSPYESLRTMTVKAMGSGSSWQQFNGDLEIAHNLLRNRVKLSTEVNAMTMDNARINLLLQTPWQKLETLRLGASHIYQTRERCLTVLTYEYNQHKGTINHEQNVRSGRDFDGKTRIEYKQGSVITFDHRVSVPQGNSGRITATLTTPYNEARNVEFTGNFNGPWDNFRTTFEIVINRMDRINGNAEYSVRPQQGMMKVAGGITTPYQALRNAQASYQMSGSPFDHRGPDYTSDIEVSYQINDKRWWSKRTINVDADGAFKMNVKATSPMTTTPTEFNLEHTPKNGRNGERGWSNSAWFEVEGVRYSGEAEYIWRNDQQLNAKIKLNIPPEEYSIMLNHRDVNGQISTELTGKAGRQGTGSLSYTMNPAASNIELTANIQTQYQNYERFDLTFKHNGPSNNFKTIANLQTSHPRYRRFNAELSHNGQANNFNCNFKLETPFTSIPSLSVRLSHRMTQNSLDASIQAEYAGKTISSQATYNNDGQTVTVRVTLQTPYQGYDSFSINFDHSGELRSGTRTNLRLNTPFNKLPELNLGLELTSPRIQDVRAKLTVRASQQESTITYQHNQQRDSDVRASVEVTTPISGYERSKASLETSQGVLKVNVEVREAVFTGELNLRQNDMMLKAEIRVNGRQQQIRYALNYRHKISPGTFELNAEFTTTHPGYDKFSLAIQHQPSGSYGFKSSGKIETPLQGWDKAAYEIEYTKSHPQANNFRSSAKITTPLQRYREFQATLNHEPSGNGFQTSGRITTPFRQAPQIDYTIKYRGRSWADFTTGFEVQYDGKKIELESAFKFHEPNGYETDYSGSIKINSPCPYLRNLEVSASHNRKTQLKSGALLVQYNGDKKVDLDYSYTTDGPHNIVINLKDPYQINSNLRVGDSSGTGVVSWDPTDRSKHIKFDFGFKDVKTETSSERLLRFKTSIPNSRTLGFLFGYSCSPNKFSSKGDLYWDRDYAPDFSYEIESNKMGSSYLNGYDGKLKIVSDIVNFDTQYNHKSQTNGRYETEISAGGQSNRLTFKSDLNKRSDSDYVHQFTIRHPRLTQDISIQTEVRNGNSFKSTLNFERQSATLEGSFSDQSRDYRNKRYTSSIQFIHPNSQTDIKLTGLVYSDESKVGGSLESQYKMSRDRQVQISTLKAEIDKIKHELFSELQTPLENFQLKTKNRGSGYEEGVYRYDLIAAIGRHEYKYSADLSKKDRSVDLKLYDNTDYIQIFTQFYSPLQSQVDISRTIQGRKHNDVQISLSMNDEKTIKGRAYIRPQILQDLRSYFQALDRYPPSIIRNLIQSRDRLSSSMSDEWQLKKRAVQDSMRNIIQVIEDIQSEISQKYQQLKSAFNAAYYRNDFYMKDIHEALMRYTEDIRRSMQSKMEEMRRSYYDFSQKAKQANKIVADKLNEISEALAQNSADIKYKIDQSLRSTSQYFDGVNSKIREKILAYIHQLENHPVYRDYAIVKPSDFLLPPDQWMDRIKANYARVMAKLEADLDQYVANNRPQIEKLKQKLTRYLQENQEWFRKFGLEGKLREYMTKLHMMTWPQLKEQIKKVLNDYFQPERTKWTVWDPRRGEYAFEIYVPVEMPEFSSIQKVYGLDLLSSPKSYLPNIYFPSDWTLMDLVIAYRPATDVSNWVPPFKSHATIIGNQHFMTFDRKFYEFAGECSYLLARDFIDKTFSVIVNYERTGGMPVKKSISVVSDGKQMDITTDGKLTVDGRRTEMPYQIGNTSVSREGNTIAVKNKLGVEIVCDLPHDHCTVSVSGWYYGKTAGLMGTYDNEQYNDFMGTDKRLRSSVSEMAESWTAGSRCSPTNHATIVRPDTSSRRYRACAEVFESDSSIMRPCFKKISPKPFMDMCLNDVPQNDNSLSGQMDICRSAASYKYECGMHDAHVRMPSQCVQCEVPQTREKFYEGETKKIEGRSGPKAADVVFVVQHAPCNRDVISKIRESLDDMRNAFQAQGLRDVRYALVGFGGSDHLSDAHVHTMDGQIFAESSQLASAIYAFSTQPLQASQQADAMGALAYAAKLPFRAGVSKSVILVACDSCQEFSIRYSDVQRVLIQADVHLHVLVPQPIRLKSRSPKTSLIFGVDDDTVYTGKDVSDDDLSGDADLRKYIRLPKDLCVALTHETDGSVFSSTQWTQSQGNLQKKFTDFFCRTVALKAEPTECQQCECVPDETGSGVAQCSSCNRRNSLFYLLPNFNDGDYSDEISDVRQISRGRNDNDDDDDDDDEDASTGRNRDRGQSSTPNRRPPKKNGPQDRVVRPRRPSNGPRPVRPGSSPEVRDQ